MKTKLTLFVTVLAAALFLGGCESTNGTNEPADEEKPTVDPLKNGLVAYYPFNGNAKDESGNGHDGDVKGATLSADRHGVTSSAYSFDGVDDFILIMKSSCFTKTSCKIMSCDPLALIDIESQVSSIEMPSESILCMTRAVSPLPSSTATSMIA